MLDFRTGSQILPARPCPHKRRNDLVTVSERGSGAGVRALDIAHEGICNDGSGNSTLLPNRGKARAGESFSDSSSI